MKERQVLKVRPDTLPWTPVSPTYRSVLWIAEAISTLAWTAAFAVPLVLRQLGVWPALPLWVALAIVAIPVVWGLVALILIPRRVRAMGYVLREDDLVFRHGILVRVTEVIPYGRVQYVDLQAGPLMRAFGLCTVHVHTASPVGHPRLPGLLLSDGEGLRDELARRGEERLAGL